MICFLFPLHAKITVIIFIVIPEEMKEPNAISSNAPHTKIITYHVVFANLIPPTLSYIKSVWKTA